jgi:hypothetical protein
MSLVVDLLEDLEHQRQHLHLLLLQLGDLVGLVYKHRLVDFLAGLQGLDRRKPQPLLKLQLEGLRVDLVNPLRRQLEDSLVVVFLILEGKLNLPLRNLVDFKALGNLSQLLRQPQEGFRPLGFKRHLLQLQEDFQLLEVSAVLLALPVILVRVLALHLEIHSPRTLHLEQRLQHLLLPLARMQTFRQFQQVIATSLGPKKL